MIELTEQEIRLDVVATSKEEAIRAAGGVLVERGYIEPGYVESMLGREAQANTYLGNGIAIPHGMAGDRALILRTGIAVVQLADGVEWNPGQTVRLVVAIAAKSDEHLGVLAALSDVLDDEELARRLAETDDRRAIADALTRRRASAAPASGDLPPGAPSIEVQVVGAAGLHARPATVLTEVAREFAAEIRVSYDGREANAKALASLLKLGVEPGATVRITAAGDDAEQALQALVAAIASGLGEEEETQAIEELARVWEPVTAGRHVEGIAASPGFAIGRLHRHQNREIAVVDDPRSAPDEEKRRLADALAAAREQLECIGDALSARSGRAEAAIFRAHMALLDDSDMTDEVHALIDAGHSAAWSWQRTIGQRVTELLSLSNERLAARAADMRDVGQRVLRLLAQLDAPEPALPSEPVILVADDLTPSDTARLDPALILGICTAAGGPTSHTSIIARSLDIPAVVGAGADVLALTPGITAILDGAAGRLYVEPAEADLESARAFSEELARGRDVELATRFVPAMLTDGVRVEVVANIGRASEAMQAVEAGGEGVGLMRSEFLFLDRDTAPSEQEQFEAFSEMTAALAGLPLIIRTLDIGGDKALPYMPMPHEENPFLGVRGVRLCLRRPELFVPHLRAIYRAASTGPVKIMLPMVSTIEEVRAVREIAGRVRAELDAPEVEIGIMIEVPSAVLMARELAAEVDFFSIGTNDLTQYVMAIDRQHPELGRDADALHPAVLRMIDMTVRAAESRGRWVGVCGGAAGDPLGAVILVGLGVAELSMSVPSIPVVKAALRRTSSAAARGLARRALACATASEVRHLVA